MSVLHSVLAHSDSLSLCPREQSQGCGTSVGKGRAQLLQLSWTLFSFCNQGPGQCFLDFLLEISRGFGVVEGSLERGKWRDK